MMLNDLRNIMKHCHANIMSKCLLCLMSVQGINASNHTCEPKQAVPTCMSGTFVLRSEILKQGTCP